MLYNTAEDIIKAIGYNTPFHVYNGNWDGRILPYSDTQVMVQCAVPDSNICINCQYQKYILKSWLIDIDKENPLDIEALTFEESDLFNADPKVVEDFKADLVKHNLTLDELFKFVRILSYMNWDQKNQLDPDNKYK